MKSLCFTVLLPLLPLLSVARLTTFNQCLQFFGNRAPPLGLRGQNNNRYREICQCLPNQNNQLLITAYRYATLYDTENKIPVYSAYEFTGHEHVDREDSWWIEPQLDGGKQQCMGRSITINPANRGRHQALSSDYESSGYERGHLFPVYHTRTYDAMLATFTLTNAAPQDSTFNRGSWRKHEECVSCFMEEACQNRKAFVVTGVVPGVRKIGNGVRVAKMYWRAFCCRTVVGPNNMGPVYSAGYIGPDQNGKVQKLSVKDLNDKLSSYYKTKFQIFPRGC